MQPACSPSPYTYALCLSLDPPRRKYKLMRKRKASAAGERFIRKTKVMAAGGRSKNPIKANCITAWFDCAHHR